MKKSIITATIFIGFLSSCISDTPVKPAQSQVPEVQSVEIEVLMNKENLGKQQELSMQEIEFFDLMGIRVDNKAKEQFIVGDNIEGYFEGYTNSYNQGSGYLMGSTTIYKNFASYVGKDFLNRKKTTISQTVMPYGTTIQHEKNINEEFVLHSKNSSLSLRVTSAEPQILGIVPILLGNPNKWKLTQTDTDVYFESSKSVISFTANQPFKLTMNNNEKYPEIRDVLKQEENSFKGVFTSINKTEDLILYMGFSPTIEEAKIKSQELRENEAHSREKKNIYNLLTKSNFKTDDKDYNKAVNWAKYSAYTMVVEEFGKGIWAGLPWFKDNWGRDTFIALPGTLLVSGHFEEAKEVLNNFATFQNIGNAEIVLQFDDKSIATEIKRLLRKRKLKLTKANTISLTGDFVKNPEMAQELLAEITTSINGVKGEVKITTDESFGRIPNRVTSLENMIYNTTDGTPWLIREIYEYIQYTGDTDYGKEVFPMIEMAIDGVLTNFVDSDGYMTHDDADTWMDARINGDKPWSARGSRAVEIQALWHSMLEISAYLAKLNNREDLSTKWMIIADKLKENFTKDFWNNDDKILADRLREDNSPDERVRPNQLMVLSIPLTSSLLTDEKEAWVVKNTATDLLYPYGISSLSEDDKYFHPFHENLRYHHKDAAYHNGTIWGWNAGLIVYGLNKYGYQDFSYELTKNLTNQILNMGTLGSMSENLSAYPDKRGNIILSGTYSQAWSVSEFARNAYQDYLGFRPKLISNTLEFTPAFPSSWNKLEANLPFGSNDKLHLVGSLKAGIWTFKLKLISENPIQLVWNGLDNLGRRVTTELKLQPGENSFIWNPKTMGKVTTESYYTVIEELEFKKADIDREFPMYIKKHTLQELILKGDYK